MWYKYLPESEDTEKIMPQVIRQSPADKQTAPAVKKTGGILDRAISVSEVQSHGLKVCFYGRNGTGKCLGRGTPVLMFDGSVKAVEDIEPGDKLMGPDSTARTVLVTSQGIGPLYRVVPLKGDSWVCNDAHILTLTGVAHVYGQVRDVSVIDYLAAKESKSPHCDSWRLMRTGVKFPHRESLCIPPYLVGLWMGDGARGTTRITNARAEIHRYCETAATSLGLVCQIVPEKNTFRVSFATKRGTGGAGPNFLLNFFRDQCSAGEVKRIPREYLTSSRQERLELLAGILDTDAEATGNSHTTVNVTGEPYRDGLLFLCRSLGLAAYCTRSETHACANGKISTYFNVSISGELSEVPTKVRTFPNRRIGKRPTVVGFDLEEIGKGEYFGFTLDGDGRFLLGDFTVTHNTTLACKFPKPLLLLGFEDGTKSVRTVPGVRFVRVYSSREYEKLADKSNAMSAAELEAATAELSSSGYKTAVLDTITALENILLAEVTQQERAPVQLRFGKYPREVYFARAEKLKERLRDFFDAADRTNINLVVLAQERDHTKKTDEDSPVIEEYGEGIMLPFIGAGVGESSAKFVHEGCDYLMQTFAREKKIVVETEVAGEKVKNLERTGKPEFCLRTVRTHNVYAAKLRTPESLQVPPVLAGTSDEIWAQLTKFMK